jgi:hypothetical protein
MTDKRGYEPPTVEDLGTLEELTEAGGHGADEGGHGTPKT